MTKRMLIDTTHAEETRVVVLDGNRLDDYDVETSSKKQLKGNIYLAKIVRIEPSLQAAFVEYGGNRHGFLAFSEIHPDYYQIPVADRERLIALQEEEARAEEARADREDEASEEETDAAPPVAESRNGSSNSSSRNQRGGRRDSGRRDSGRRSGSHSTVTGSDEAASADADKPLDQDAAPDAGTDIGADTHPDVPVSQDALPETPEARQDPSDGADASDSEPPDEDHAATARPVIEMPLEIETDTVVADSDSDVSGDADSDEEDDGGEDADGSYAPAPETISGESGDDGQAQRRTARFLRQYKIQEVMRRRQIILVQVVKEERGNKGAALTTYISLAGRFSVLMPNSPRGGGVSRKITSATDRRRLKEITQELEIPRGMGMIVRTAGAQRPRAEIRRDGEYLLRTWDEIRETTLGSTAPCLVYEEASLIKRAIRDVYTRDVEEIVVDGEAGWKSAREFMRTLMPSNANKVGLWRDSGQTLFGHHGVEHHLDAMLQPTVQLRSGGYLVINQTEALVAIDVNSGRSTRERGIEETAFRTNMEAADEVARQLRLRDLAGLIVIDFIDMEVRRNNATVERRLKDALSNDRARIQVGSISHFGLLEMSRQRLRPSIAESSFVTCPHCAGTGFVRGTESSALHVLRAIEEEAGKRKASEILVHVASPVALYVLNHKRAWLGEIETRYGLTVHLAADDSLLPPNLRIDRIRPYLPPVAPEAALQAAPHSSPRAAPAPAAVTAVPIAAAAPPSFDPFETGDKNGDENGDETGSTEPRADVASTTTDGEAGTGETDENRRRKRRRRRRGGRRENGSEAGSEGGAETGDAEAGFADDADETDAAGTVLPAEAATGTDQPAATVSDAGTGSGSDAARSDGQEADGASRGRRRRGGRNRNRNAEAGAQSGYERSSDDRSETVEADTARPAPRAYNGPTPADPFAGSFDIFEMIERDAEEMSAVMSPTAASAASHQPAVPVAPVAETVPEIVAETTAAGDALSDRDATAPIEQAAELPAEQATDATVQPVDAEAAPVTDVEQADAAPAAGPKPRKPRASRARKTADATVQTAVAAVEQPAATAEPVADVAEPAAAPTKPRRKPAARARKATPVADTTDAAAPAAVALAAEPDAPEAATADTVAPVPVTSPAPATAATEPTAATTGADPSIVQPQVIGDSAPPTARRTGWWKR